MKILDISGEDDTASCKEFDSIKTKKYLYKVMPSKVEDSSTGPVFFVNAEGEVVEVPMETAIFFDRKFWNVGSWAQICPYPFDLSLWGVNAAVVDATGNTVGGLTEWSITDKYTTATRANVFSGTGVVGKQRCCIGWNIGTSGTGRILCYGSGPSSYALWSSTNNTWEVQSNAAGTLTIDKEIDHPAGFKLVMFTIDWIVTSQLVAFGSYSSTLKNILCYGCLYLTSLSHVYPFTNPSGSTTVASRAGTTIVPITSKLEDILDGSKACKFVIKLVPMFASSGFPVSHEESILNTGTVDILTLSTDASGNGYINLSDGTNTATVAYDWDDGEELMIEAPIGYNVAEAANKMQLKVNGEVSALTAFDSSFGPDTEMIMGQNNDYQFGISMSVYSLKQGDFE